MVGAEELALAILTLTPSAQRRGGGPIDRYRLIGTLGFATGLVPRVAGDPLRAEPTLPAGLAAMTALEPLLSPGQAVGFLCALEG
jgi:hypothetical protein